MPTLELFPEELARIRWRALLMSITGGPEWLIHVSGLYDCRERLLGPDHIGLPDDLRKRLHAAHPRT